MIQIKKIEIRYFRSIYQQIIDDLRDVVVLSGKNDCGKSNVIRALNLFFNNQTGWNESLVFERDFCRKRLEECRATVKAKQFIQIRIHFIRGNRYERSLPEEFWVCKKWTRDSNIPSESNSLRENEVPAKSLDRAQASLQRYLGTIRLEYVPAVKDRSFFNYSLGILQEAILQSTQNESLKQAVDGLNTTVKDEAQLLHEEFSRVSGVDIQIHLPDNIEDLFRAFAVSTGGLNGFPLGLRGDGIQARFLPSLIHHVANRSLKQFIWGFEEPENCLEHALATKLAEDIAASYSKRSQIVLSSHSPAFITLARSNTSIFRVCSENSGTVVTPISISNKFLAEDLGLVALQRQYQKDVIQELETIKKAKATIEQVLANTTSPILLVEGKTDKLILEEAWKRLYPASVLPFRIISANTAVSSDPNSKAGASVLRKALESCREDCPKMIGLLDYDDAGLEAFKLDNNFKSDQAEADAKISTNNHVACMLLPADSHRDVYRDASNLSIEFLFPDGCITKRIDEKGLHLVQKKLVSKVGAKVITSIQTTDPQYRDIEGGKVDFASTVVPTFDDADFDSFKPLFERLKRIFLKLT